MEYGAAHTPIRRGASWREALYVAAVFIGLSALLVSAMTRWNPFHNTPFGGDPAFFLWALKWWPHSLFSLHDPFQPPIFYPHGENLAWITSVPTVALIAAPITLLAGPILALNAINTLALVANGTLVYLIGRELDCKKFSACVGAILFYFSSYTWGQLLGHLGLVVSAFAIALVYLTILRVEGRTSRIKYIATAALLLALQFGVSNEVYATLIFFSAIAAIVLLLSFGWKVAWKKVVCIGSEWTFAILGSLLLLSPYLYEMFTHFVSNFQNISQYVADPINYVVPTQTNWLLGRAFSAVSSKFAGNMSEQNVYLGLPTLALLAIAGRGFYSKPLNRALLISLLVVALCSFGPRLTLLGIPTVWLPWSWVEKLPLIGEALPSRFGLYTSLLAAILVGRILTAVPKWDTKVLAVASLCLVLPNLGVYWPGRVPQSSFFTSGAYKSAIPESAKVLVLPTYERGGYQPATWQAQSNFWFVLTNGPAPAYASTRAKYPSLFAPGGNSGVYGYALLMFMEETGTQFVLTDAGESDGLTEAFRALKFPYQQYGPVEVFEISKAALEGKIAKLRASSFLTVCDSLVQLAKTGSNYVSKGAALSSLTPSMVANSEFDTRFGNPLSPESPAANWTTKGYWLGGWDDAIAIGISPIDGSLAARLYASFRDQAQEIYFPYPKAFLGEERPAASGQFLVVLKHGAVLPASCSQ